MIHMNDKNSEKKVIEYNCIFCNYKCCKKQHYKQHLLTTKHKIMTNDDKNSENSENSKNLDKYFCECGLELFF